LVEFGTEILLSQEYYGHAYLYTHIPHPNQKIGYFLKGM